MKNLVVTSILLFLLFSCNRTEIGNFLPKNDISIEEAKNWFTSTYTTKSEIGREAISNKYQREIIWGLSNKIIQKNGIQIIITPIAYKGTKKPGVVFWDDKSNASAKKPILENVRDIQECLFVYKDQNGQTQANIGQYIPDTEYKTKNKGKISKSDFTGQLMVIDWNENPIEGFIFKNGKVVKRLTYQQQNSGGRTASCSYSYSQYTTVNCQSCGVNCSECTVTLTTNINVFCTNDPTSTPSEEGSSSGSGVNYSGGTETANITNLYIEMMNSTDIRPKPGLNPCWTDVINKVTSDRLKSTLIKQVLQYYGSNDNTHNIDIYPAQPGTQFEPGIFGKYIASQRGQRTDEIYLLNNFNAVNTPSQEFLASVLLHEFTHGIFNWGIRDPNIHNSQQEHDYIFKNWTDNIIEALTATFPNLPRRDAAALALGGLMDSAARSGGVFRPNTNQVAQQNFQLTLEDATAIQAQYAAGNSGTKCNGGN